MQVMRRPRGSLLRLADALVVHCYRSKHHLMEFNDDLVDGTPEGIELVERLDAWNRVRRFSGILRKTINVRCRWSSLRE